MLYILPLEPLPERYTEQWYRWFDAIDVPHTMIDGEQLTNCVECGVVLDAEGTNYWKFSQLMQVCRLFKAGVVKNGDVFFTMDLWHPGLEAIRYMATLEGIKVGLFGFLHAGSYTTEDFASPMADWAQFHEIGWAAACDAIFVGTEYHKRKFMTERLFPYHLWHIGNRIFVTGNPFNFNEVLQSINKPIPAVDTRKNIIIYPNRFDIEKRPDVFMLLMDALWNKRQDFEVWITTSRPTLRSNNQTLIDRLYACKWNKRIFAGISKEDYYKLMAEAKIYVSTTIEENFGYCLLEAVTFGVCPVVPNDYSHIELLSNDTRFLYANFDAALDKIDRYLDYPYSYTGFNILNYAHSIDEMLKIMKEKGYKL